jgi:hypothetical protein
VVESQVVNYVRALTSTCAPLPTSALERERRGSVLARPRAASGERGAARGVAPVGRVKALDAQPLRHLCLRLNNCEWAGEQLLSLAARLRADVAGLGRLPGKAVVECERSCRDLLDYITAKAIFYDLEPIFVTSLYSPRPEDARVMPLLDALQPKLVEMRLVVAPRWTQRLLEGVLSTFAIATAAVIELPNRTFEPRHRSLLDSDVEAIASFFLRASAGILEEAVVRAALNFLHALGEQACSK